MMKLALCVMLTSPSTSLRKLKEIARDVGVVGYSRFRKTDRDALIQKIVAIKCPTTLNEEQKLTAMTMNQLKSLAKQYGLIGCSRMRASQKAQLIQRLLNDPTEEQDEQTKMLSLPMRQLKAKAKEVGLKGYSKMKLADRPLLVQRILEKMSAPAPTIASVVPTEDDDRVIMATLTEAEEEEKVPEIPPPLERQEAQEAEEAKEAKEAKDAQEAEEAKDAKDAEEVECDMSSYTVKELKQMAKEYGLKGYSKLKKAELIDMLSPSNEDDEETDTEDEPEDEKMATEGQLATYHLDGKDVPVQVVQDQTDNTVEVRALQDISDELNTRTILSVFRDDLELLD